MPPATARLREQRVDAHLLKPVQQEELLETIYEGVDHGFVKDGKPDSLTALAARQETVKFLIKHLGRAVGK